MRKKVFFLFLIATIAVAGAADELETVAAIGGTDRIAAVHVRNLLASHGIESTIEGSVVYGISVPKARADEAVRLLRADAKISGYYIQIGKDEIPAAPGKVVLRNVTYAAALKEPEYAETTALGKFLRRDEIAGFAKKYPYIFSFTVTKRTYLATPSKSDVGYDIELELHKSPVDGSDGYKGCWQVWDEGRQVQSQGSNQWSFGK